MACEYCPICGMPLECDEEVCPRCEHKIGKVRDINEKKPHAVSETICVSCYHRWICVRPETTLLKELQCPECLTIGTVIETGQSIE